MAHNLAFNEDGTAKFFSVRKPAWHKLGTIIPEKVTASEALALAGLNYEVDKVQRYAQLSDGNFIPHAGGYETIRLDTNEILGSVGERYEVIQNEQAFAFLDEIAGTKGQAVYETAGALGNGERVWMLMCLPETILVAGEGIKPYFIASTSHDGSAGLEVHTSFTRVVCQNTLNMSLQNAARKFSVRHTKNYNSRAAEARSVMGFILDYKEQFQKQADKLLDERFTHEQFRTLGKLLLPEPKEIQSMGHTKWENQFKSLMGTINAEDLENVKGTKWAAYNAVVDYSDHLRGTKGNDQEKLERVFVRSFSDDAPSSGLKDKALQHLLTV